MGESMGKGRTIEFSDVEMRILDVIVDFIGGDDGAIEMLGCSEEEWEALHEKIRGPRASND